MRGGEGEGGGRVRGGGVMSGRGEDKRGGSESNHLILSYLIVCRRRRRGHIVPR